MASYAMRRVMEVADTLPEEYKNRVLYRDVLEVACTVVRHAQNGSMAARQQIKEDLLACIDRRERQ